MMRKFLVFLIASLSLAACERYDANLDTETVVTDNYNKVFVETFGEPAKDQDWGFKERTLPSSFYGTRTAETDGNEWENNGYIIPPAITEDEREQVLAVFNQKGEEHYTSLVDLDCFFVQQVYKGNAQYINHDNYTVTGSDHMDWLCTLTNKHINVISWWPYKDEIIEGEYYDDHINNFNYGDCGAWDGKMLMVNTDSHTFGFKASEDNGHVFYNFRMEEINGSYYVGFDFEADGENPNEQVDRDYIYNDWIVKIVPGKGTSKPERYTVRIICEDLTVSTGTDFDYNDVVFDVSYTEGENKTTVTVQAAGGTIPLYVHGYEVHELFANANKDKNISVTTPINVHATNGFDDINPVSFEINSIVAPWDVIVEVYKEHTVIPLRSDIGEPAAKIAVDPDFQWVNERVHISSVYPDFKKYVKDTTVKWY